MNLMSGMNQDGLWILILLLILSQSQTGCCNPCDPCGNQDNSSWLLWIVIAMLFLNGDANSCSQNCC